MQVKIEAESASVTAHLWEAGQSLGSSASHLVWKSMK